MTADEARFQRVYEQHYPHVHAYCRRRVAAERVDDAVAETFLVAWRRRSELPESERILPWLYRVAYRVVGHEWRHRSRGRRLVEKASTARPTQPESPEDSTMRGDEVTLVLQAAARLQPQDAEILRLVSWEQLSRTEVADVLGISTNLVSKRLERARKRLTHEYHLLNQDDRSTRPIDGDSSQR